MKAQLIEYLLATVIVGVCVWWLEAHGYKRGAAARDAYYEPILQAEHDAKIEADTRTANAEKRAADYSLELETEHVDTQNQLAVARGVAERRIADILRQHRAETVGCDRPVPAATGAPAEPSGTPAGPAHDGSAASGLGQRLADDAAQCEHDANEVAEWQRWYDHQRQSLNQPGDAK